MLTPSATSRNPAIELVKAPTFRHLHDRSGYMSPAHVEDRSKVSGSLHTVASPIEQPKVTDDKIENVRPYMNFFPRARRLFIDTCNKIKQIWESFIGMIASAWHKLVGYRQPGANVPVHTAQATTLASDAEKYAQLVGADPKFMEVFRNIEADAPCDLGIQDIGDRTLRALIPQLPPAVTHVERVGLVLTSLWLDRLPFMAATAMILQGLESPRLRLVSSSRLAIDFLALGALDAVVGPFARPVSVILRAGMLLNLVSGEFTGKAVSEHVERWLLTKMRASQEDQDRLRGLRMPASASNEQVAALERVHQGTGSAFDVRIAAEGLFESNIIVQMGKQYDATIRAIRIHNTVAAVSFAGMALMVTSKLTSDLVTRSVVPLTMGAARWFLPQIANLEHHAFIEIRQRFPMVVEAHPTMTQALIAANGASMVNSCLSLGPSALSSLSPLVSASALLLPTASQFDRFKQGDRLGVGLDIGYTLAPRVASYMVASALMGPVSGALASSAVAFATQNWSEYDALAPTIKTTHAVLAAIGAMSVVVEQAGGGFVAKMVTDGSTLVSAALPSAGQIETFRRGEQVSAVAQMVLAASCKVVLAYGVKTASEYFMGPGAGMMAMAAVTGFKPMIDRFAASSVELAGEKGSLALRKAGSFAQRSAIVGTGMARSLALNCKSVGASGDTALYVSLGGLMATSSTQLLPMAASLGNVLPYVAVLTPSEESVDAFKSGECVSAVSQWALASLVKGLVTYGIVYGASGVVGVPEAGFLAYGVVEIASPALGNVANRIGSTIGKVASSAWSALFGTATDKPALI